jgi:tRNA(Ile)-lysidine synthase
MKSVAEKKLGARGRGAKARVVAGAAENSKLQRRLLRAIPATRLLRTGARVGVAVSGGADSVALLFLLAELRRELGLTLCVMHFHHGLRGRAADADEKFVMRLAARLELPFYCGRADVAGIARRGKLNLEDAARRERYAFFARCVEEHRLDAVAVAHTADDQAETVLGHILRGSGITGLGGIHPQAGKIVRPLLGVRRAELRAFLKGRREKWREDATNRDVSRTRARIRGKLLPLMKRDFQPRVVEHLAALAEHARADEGLLARVVEKKFASVVEILPEGLKIGVAELLGDDARERKFMGGEAEEALARRVVRRIVHESKERSGNAGEMGAQHVEKVMELARCGRAGLAIPLPGGVEVRRYADALVFRGRMDARRNSHSDPARAAETNGAGKISYEHKFASLGALREVAVRELGCAFRFRVIDCASERGETSISGEVLDGARLRYPLTLRNWRFGDRFHARERGKPHKLKRLFSEKGIDRWRRDGWPVLVSGESLAWSREFGAAAEFAADSGTKTGIVIVEEKLE